MNQKNNMKKKNKYEENPVQKKVYKEIKHQEISKPKRIIFKKRNTRKILNQKENMKKTNIRNNKKNIKK